MDYSLGFNGYFQLNTWTPFTVVLENRGKTIRGRLEVIVTSGTEYQQNLHQTTYSMDIELASNSRKSFWFTILLSSFTHDVVIKLRQLEETLLSDSINLKPYYSTRNLAVVVDDTASHDFLSMLSQHLFSVNVSPRFLPETWYGYESVKIVIINTEILKSLREQQFKALEQWIAQGGYLVTTGGINYGSLLEKRIQRVLPTTIKRAQQLFELRSLEGFCDQAFVSSTPFLVLPTTIKDSHVVLQEQDIPIIIQKPVGLGSILFIAFDFLNPPFSHWVGKQDFWNKILSLKPSHDDNILDIDTQNILDLMLSSILADFPDFRVAFLFVSVYFILLKIFLKKIETYHEQRWKNVRILLLLISIFFAIGYRLFVYPTNKGNLTYNSFFHIHLSAQHTITFGKYIIGLYSIQATEYHVYLEVESSPVTHLVLDTSERKIPDRYILHENSSGQQSIRASSKNWSYNFFMTFLPVEFPIVGQAI